MSGFLRSGRRSVLGNIEVPFDQLSKDLKSKLNSPLTGYWLPFVHADKKKWFESHIAKMKATAVTPGKSLHLRSIKEWEKVVEDEKPELDQWAERFSESSFYSQWSSLKWRDEMGNTIGGMTAIPKKMPKQPEKDSSVVVSADAYLIPMASNSQRAASSAADAYLNHMESTSQRAATSQENPPPPKKKFKRSFEAPILTMETVGSELLAQYSIADLAFEMGQRLIIHRDHNGNAIPNINEIIVALQHHAIDGERLLQLKTVKDYTMHGILVYGDACRFIEFLNGFIGETTDDDKPLASLVAPANFFVESLQNEATPQEEEIVVASEAIPIIQVQEATEDFF